MEEDYSNLFTVSPMGQNVTLVPGETYEGSINVTNPAAATRDFTYVVAASAYGVTGDDYTASFSRSSERSKIVDWITIENPTGTLKPNETRTVNFKINVPADAAGGGQYAALIVSSAERDAQQEGVSVNNIFEIASLLFAKVDGEIHREGKILNNEIPGFVTSLPIVTSVKVENDGNIHETAKVAIKVKDFFSKNIIYPESGESGAIEETIIPETTREITRNVEGMSQLGVFEVTQTLSYMGKESEIKQTVVVCPVWFMVLVLATITAVIVAIVAAVKRHRRNCRVI